MVCINIDPKELFLGSNLFNSNKNLLEKVEDVIL